MIAQLSNPLDFDERMRSVRRYLDALDLNAYRALVFGSVARGDFVAESDTDLLIISDALPEDPRARMDVLYDVHHIAPEVEAVGWRQIEWERRRRDGDLFVGILEREALDVTPTGQQEKSTPSSA